MPYADKTITILKKLIFILIVLPCLTFSQVFNEQIIGTYLFSGGGFNYRLEIKQDSTFVYEQSFESGSTKSSGKWRFNNNTLTLLDYKTPWSISNVVEKKIDSLKNRILVEIKVGDSSEVKIRGDHTIFIDGNRTSVKYDFSKGVYKVVDFDVWLNSNCNAMRKTNKTGLVEFKVESPDKINIDYASYKVKDIQNNYFILTLSTTPIIYTPPILKWTKWKLKKNKLTPLECDAQINRIELKR